MSFLPKAITLNGFLVGIFGLLSTIIYYIDVILNIENEIWDDYIIRKSKRIEYIYITTSLLFIVAMGLLLFFLIKDNNQIWISTMMYFIYLLLIISAVSVFVRNMSGYLFKKYFPIIFLFIIITFKAPLYIFNIDRARVLKENMSNKNIAFKYKNTFLKSDKSKVFLGETHDFIFMYNRIDSTTQVYNRKDIDSLIFK